MPGTGYTLVQIYVNGDMAGTAIFLASRAGDYVVGDTIAVDGGIAYASLHPGPA